MDRRQGRGKRTARLILLIFTILISWYLLSQKHSSKIRVNLPTPTPNCPVISYETNNNSLAEAVNSALIGTHGTYGIVVKNLKNGAIYSQNEDAIFDSASLYKLWVMAVVYQQISDGKLKMNQTLSANYSDLNKEFFIDTNVAEKTDGVFKTTVSDALAQMITLSDNYSALILTKAVGINKLQDFLASNCFTQSKVGINGKSPVTSARDVALFFEKLYMGKLGNHPTTNQMISLLKQQKFTDKIPKYLPYVIQLSVAHKTGELDPYSHDAGIVYSDDGDYIIVVMSKSDSRDLANERIANVSKSVYFYFNPNDDEASASATVVPEQQ